jgi:hypothetical protein
MTRTHNARAAAAPMAHKRFMQWCYFLRDGCIAGFAMLPSGLPDRWL